MDKNQYKLFSKIIITLLKPLLRVLIQNEITHAEFSDIAKRAYLEVAYEHFSIPKRKMTFARVAVLTGLSRKEVAQMSKTADEEQTEHQYSPNRAMRVVNGWMNDAEYPPDEDGVYRLPIKGDTGSFTSLVAKYSGDISLGAVIDELQRIGVAKKIRKDSVELIKPGYIPSDDVLEKIRIMSVCASDLLNTAVHNLNQEGEQARFQRQLDYQHVPESVVEEFKQYSHKRSNDLLQDLNQFLAERIRQCVADGEPNNRVGLGIYFFHTDGEKG